MARRQQRQCFGNTGKQLDGVIRDGLSEGGDALQFLGSEGGRLRAP